MKTLPLFVLLFCAAVGQAKVTAQHFEPGHVPAFIGRSDISVGTLVVTADADEAAAAVSLALKAPRARLPKAIRLGKIEGKLAGGKATFRVPLRKGENRFEVYPDPGTPSSLTDCLSIEGSPVRIGSVVTWPNQRIADRNRTSKNFRIPGIAETRRGTLVATFDIRYANGRDLPGDICVGVSVSHDKGLSWSPIVTAIDYKDLPGGKGVGDPCILVDPANNRVWIMAVNSSKRTNPIWSKSGTLNPAECGQLVLAYSDDEGKTWSKPINVTAEAKRLGDPDTASWGGVLQGPGQGIAMKDGTLVFPAQAWGNGGKAPHHGFLVYSKDHGKTWKGSKGMPFGGSESTVAEIEPGVLILNTREGKAGERITGITRDMGETWDPYPHTPLRQTQCQASMLRIGRNLLFSHPASMARRENMTLRVSKDKGKTWSEGLLYDRRPCVGYSSLCPVGSDSVGILYEGDGRYHYFLRVPLKNLR